MAATESDDILNPSELGLQTYWDNFYEQELENFRDHGDTGEIWFGKGTLNRVVEWIVESSRICKDARILDIGCGNGHFLLKLSEKGFESLQGIDYSPPAINLAKCISESKKVKVDYKIGNLVEDGESKIFEDLFDLCHDKGTYDAISLAPDSLMLRRRYVTAISRLLNPDGIFILNSCNWTKEELTSTFESDFRLVDTIPMQQFQFGGKMGNSVTSLVFVLNNRKINT